MILEGTLVEDITSGWWKVINEKTGCSKYIDKTDMHVEVQLDGQWHKASVDWGPDLRKNRYCLYVDGKFVNERTPARVET